MGTIRSKSESNQPGHYNETPETRTDGEVSGFEFDQLGNLKTSPSGSMSAANTARTTGTSVLPVQHIDEAGIVGGMKPTHKVSTPADAPVTAYPVVSSSTRITTATTTIVSATGTTGWFRLKVQNGTMGAVTVYDNGAASGTVMFTGTPAAKDIIFGEWTRFTTGLTIVTAAATELFVEKI